MAADAEAGGEGFDAVQTPGFAVVDCICGDEVGEESFAFAADARPGDFLDSDPGAFYYCCAMGFEEFAVCGGYYLFRIRSIAFPRQYCAVEKKP